MFLPLLVYDSAIREVKQHCITARKAALDQADAVAVSIDRAYRECPFDNANCKQLHVEGPTKYERREIHVPESFMCSTLGHLPTLILGADAAPSDAIQLVVARSKLKTYERALSSFRAQCDCGWILKDKAQLSDQINFQFVRTNMQAVDVMTELKRAIKFYELFGISAQKWIDSQLQHASKRGMMSDYGWSYLREKQYIAAVARYILVVYDGDSAFALAMAEASLAVWPSGSCDCTADDEVLTSLKDSLDARMKKSFCDVAHSHFQALPDPYDEL